MVCDSRNASGQKLVSNINVTEIEGVKLIQASYSIDLRGKFFKFNPDNLLQNRLGSVAVSINPKAGTIRGIHLQVEPFAEEKLVSCIQGSTFEVIVDIRNDSKSFGKVATFELSQENALQVYIPKGVAHGFQTLSEDCELIYLHTAAYHPESERALNAGDPKVGVAWPLPITEISEKDRTHKLIDRDFQGITL